MAKLITNHDPYHIHKILGVLVLLNYVYRSYLLVVYGSCFPEDIEKKWMSVASVLCHGLLSWSSLLLPLPKKRNFSSPMIWPEFRWHSITFATRHVIVTVLNLLKAWPESLWGNAFARACLMLGTIHAASIITDKFGCREKRTTNAMPYPKSVTNRQQSAVKLFYTLAQFGATANCLFDDPNHSFAPLLAIQAAPLLMTLVRKGKASSFTYHRVYALSLVAGYVALFLRWFTHISHHQYAPIVQNIVILAFPSSKIRRKTSARNVWIINIILARLIYPTYIQPLVETHIIPQALSHPTIFKNFIQLFVLGLMIRRVYEIGPLFVSEDWKVQMSMTSRSKTIPVDSSSRKVA